MSLPPLRRLALSSAPACTRIHRLAGGTDDGIRRVLNDAAQLAACIGAAHRLTADAVREMAEALPAEPLTETSEAAIEHVRFMNQFG